MARERRLTLRQLVEEGLRAAVERHRRPVPRFQLRDTSRDLGTLSVDGDWPRIRENIYADRGE